MKHPLTTDPVLFEKLLSNYKMMERALAKIATDRETDHIGDVWQTWSASIANNTLENLDGDVYMLVWSKYSHDQQDTTIS